ncbi:MAG: hypothetical protein NT013_21505 [Planctomycetia bacterium]|nr:hypothetical protein [Planctomycetia bacterium]
MSPTSTAGIPKRDDRGRTIEVHALRHTFGTMLSMAGVTPSVTQAAMRHSSIDLTMNVYKFPRLLDVQRAIESQPGITVTFKPSAQGQRIAAGAEILVVLITDFSRDSQSTAVTFSANSVEPSTSPETNKTPGKTIFPRSLSQYARRESNPQPSDPKSGATSIEPTKRQRVTKRRLRRGSSGGSSSPENERGEAGGGSVSSRVESLPIKADSFSAALAMIASLPLSDAEKADAVRRLMAERAG